MENNNVYHSSQASFFCKNQFISFLTCISVLLIYINFHEHHCFFVLFFAKNNISRFPQASLIWKKIIYIIFHQHHCLFVCCCFLQKITFLIFHRHHCFMEKNNLYYFSGTSLFFCKNIFFTAIIVL